MIGRQSTRSLQLVLLSGYAHRLWVLLIRPHASLLARVRWLAAVASVLMTMPLLPILALNSTQAQPLPIAASAALVTIYVRWLLQYRRGGSTMVGDTVETILLLLVGVAAGPLFTLGLFFCSIIQRSLYVALRPLLPGTLLYLGAFTATIELPRLTGAAQWTVLPMLMQLPGLVATALCVYYLRLLLEHHDALVIRERTLRGASADLVAATVQEQVYTAVIRAAVELLSPRRAAAVYLLSSNDGTAPLVVVAGTVTAASGRSLSLEVVPEEQRPALLAGQTVWLEGAVARPTRSALDPESAALDLCLTPLIIQESLRGLLIVAVDSPLSADLRNALRTIAAQAALALEGLALAENVHRRRSDARFRALVQHASDVIAIIDTGSRIRYLSPSAARVLGINPTVLEGARLSDLLHPDDAPSAVAHVASLHARPSGGTPLSFEWRLRHGDGTWHTMETLGANLQDEPTVAGVVLTMRDISVRKELEELLAHQAMHDGLTGLPNRALLNDRLEQAMAARMRSSGVVALLLMDLDRFKEVNDTLGHHAGDLLLQEIASRLRRSLRASDTVARLGGDEFAVLARVVDGDAAVRVAQTVHAAVSAPLVLEGHTVTPALSIGLALSPQHGSAAASLLRHADVAMYKAKRAGDGYAIYDPTDDQHSVARLALESELRAAVAAEHLILYYQPTLDLRTGRVDRVEALVRWQHPERGLIPPGQFIPFAEESGLIVPLTTWTLEAALDQCQSWQQVGMEIGVAVNLSMRALHSPGFPESIAALLRRRHLNPGQLVLEITESALMANPEVARTALIKLGTLGVTLAIDDFGTGYSSLSYLKQLPVNEIKIDQSFVQGMGKGQTKDGAIVRSVIELGHNLGMRVVAEGVEDVEIWRLLRNMHCDSVQGYFLSRPLPAVDLERWLTATRWGKARTMHANAG